MEEYDFKKIEDKWSKKWAESDYGKAIDGSDKPKHYHLVEFPYPSGAGLHVGHCMGYSASDAYCRMKRMQGYNVMFPIGWDAFGLPTENYAIKNKIQPSKATADNIAIFKKQINSLAYSFDFDREINTTDPKYYKWTQWIFLQFYKHAVIGNKLVEVSDDDTTTPRLAYQAEMPVNWCPSCKINLANEEVIAGKCERCGAETEKRMQKQWMLRITAYADRLISDLDKVDYEERIKTQQKNWIGRSEGASIKFKIQSSKFKNKDIDIEVFTTRADTLFGCTFMAISPENDFIENHLSTPLEAGKTPLDSARGRQISNYKEVEEYIEKAKKKSDFERADLEKDKTGVELKGIKAINPINNEEIPIYVADYVLSGYGTGAVMCVPAHDQRDFEFAKKYKIDIKKVISINKSESDSINKASTDYGKLINSDIYNGLESIDAANKIIKKLKENNAGDFAVNYKLRDWIFSRQHYWGEPIPIVYCDKCGKIPLNEAQLPLELPPVENYQPTDTGESPLAKIDDWVNTTCPKCGGSAKRETDTMPNWAGSSWYFLRYCDPTNDKQLASDDKLKYWMPVDIYNGGPEHITLHLLYSRFWYKFLYDLGKVPTIEPYQKRIFRGIILGADGRKMSKSYGNAVNPDDMIAQFGADTLRTYIMFIGPYSQESAWNMNGIQGVNRFVKKIWLNYHKPLAQSPSEKINLELNKIIKYASEDIGRFSFNTYIAKLMEFNNILSKEEKISKEVLSNFAIIFSPAMPYIASELWHILGQNNSIFESKWPIFDQSVIKSEDIEIPIQINGKVRDRIHVESDISDDDLKKSALESEKIVALLGGKEPSKIIVVPKRLVSIVL